MYKFEHAMHVYLTSVQMMTTDELHVVGLTEANRNTLLSQDYLMQQDYTLTKMLATFNYAETRNNKTSVIETCFKHSPKLEKQDLVSNIAIAAHEANHSLRQDLHSVSSKKFYKKVGYAAFAMCTGCAMFSPSIDSDYETLGSSMVVGGVLGISLYQGIKQTVHFYDEKLAYRHTGAMQQMFGNRKKSAEDIQKEKLAAQTNTSFLSTLKDCLFMGYPSQKLMRLYRLQGQEMVAKNHAEFSLPRIADIMDQTDRNIKNRAFNIYHV